MDIIKIVISGFLIIEITNVITLYLFPGSRYANAIGVFNAWEKSKGDPEIHNFVKYLVNWVAGTKLIFIMLLVVIIHVADQRLLVITCIALVFSISPFYWRLLPILRRMDENNQISPHKYSYALGVMISGFIVVFLICIALSIV